MSPNAIAIHKTVFSICKLQVRLPESAGDRPSPAGLIEATDYPPGLRRFSIPRELSRESIVRRRSAALPACLLMS
jgi:hypothetical protein